MKVIVNSITGFEDAIATMFISKRTWTPKLDLDIREICALVLDRNGFIKPNALPTALEKFNKWLGMLLRMGKKHITVLRYIDVSITTVGLHRAGQD